MFTRRTFIQSLAVTAAIGPTFLSGGSRAQEKAAANDRIQIGFIV